MRSSLAVVVALALAPLGCKEAPPPSTSEQAASTGAAAPDAAPPTEGVASAPHDSRPVVDMRGCMVLPAARERADATERAREGCPQKLHDETRREQGKNVTYRHVLNQARTDDVRARAVANTCCYDKLFHSAQ